MPRDGVRPCRSLSSSSWTSWPARRNQRKTRRFVARCEEFYGAVSLRITESTWSTSIDESLSKHVKAPVAAEWPDGGNFARVLGHF
jgi:hypothetical protein